MRGCFVGNVEMSEEVNVPNPMTRRSLIAKSAAALAALPVGAIAARSAKASAAAPEFAAAGETWPSVAHEEVFKPASMRVSFDDLPHLMSNIVGSPRVSTEGALMTYEFGPWEWESADARRNHEAPVGPERPTVKSDAQAAVGPWLEVMGSGFSFPIYDGQGKLWRLEVKSPRQLAQERVSRG